MHREKFFGILEVRFPFCDFTFDYVFALVPYQLVRRFRGYNIRLEAVQHAVLYTYLSVIRKGNLEVKFVRKIIHILRYDFTMAVR